MSNNAIPATKTPRIDTEITDARVGGREIDVRYEGDKIEMRIMKANDSYEEGLRVQSIAEKMKANLPERLKPEYEKTSTDDHYYIVGFLVKKGSSGDLTDEFMHAANEANIALKTLRGVSDDEQKLYEAIVKHTEQAMKETGITGGADMVARKVADNVIKDLAAQRSMHQ